MIRRSALVAVTVLSGLAATLVAGAQEDPVMMAKQQRSEAGNERDLPPVPRGVMEPPPLPPPETHAKDLHHSKNSKGKGKSSKSQKKSGKGGSTHNKPSTTHTSAH